MALHQHLRVRKRFVPLRSAPVFIGETDREYARAALHLVPVNNSALVRLLWGAHAPSRANFGASPKSLPATSARDGWLPDRFARARPRIPDRSPTLHARPHVRHLYLSASHNSCRILAAIERPPLSYATENKLSRAQRSSDSDDSGCPVTLHRWNPATREYAHSCCDDKSGLQQQDRQLLVVDALKYRCRNVWRACKVGARSGIVDVRVRNDPVAHPSRALVAGGISGEGAEIGNARARALPE